MSSFKFTLGAIVRLVHSNETGEIIGRAEYTTMENNYLVRYRAGDGRQVEAWWGESAVHRASGVDERPHCFAEATVKVEGTDDETIVTTAVKDADAQPPLYSCDFGSGPSVVLIDLGTLLRRGGKSA